MLQNTGRPYATIASKPSRVVEPAQISTSTMAP